MRVLHAYICEEYYWNWAREQSYLGLNVTHDVFLRQLGTPLLLFDEPINNKEFYPVNKDDTIRINPTYHMDCQPYRTNPLLTQPSEHLYSLIETALQSPTITSIRTRFFGWLNM